MTGAEIAAWVRRRTAVEWIGIGAALAVFGYVGWDGAMWDARFQLLLHLLAIGAIAGLGVIALRGGQLPRTRIDAPLLGLLAAFALGTASALNVGMSLRAMAAIVATAAMLPVALVAIRHRPTWVGGLAAVPVLLIAIPTLVALLARRVEWVMVGAPGLPPIRLPAEGTPFGSVAVPPFVIWSAWAVAGLIESPRWRRIVQVSLVVVGIPLTVLSGSRSAWLAIGAACLVAAVPWAWHRRHHLLPSGRPGPRELGLGLAAIVGIGAVAILAAPRLTAVTSLVYRASLWRDTLNAWRTDPLLGIGPGFMPYARQAAAPDYTFPVRQPHSHNLPLGVLGDAGIVGLVAALVLMGCVAWFAGPWRARTPAGRVAGFVLIGLAVGGLFEDLTFLPNFNLLAVLVVAIALSDARAVTWVRLPSGRLRAAGSIAGGAIALVLLWAMVVADAGAIAYRAGTDAAADEDWVAATDHLARAVQIDRWHPAGPKALAVAADRNGDAELARRAAESAVELNPGDAPSWINLALLCQQLGDPTCQAHATDRAVATAGFLDTELLNAAYSYEALGQPDRADDAYRRSLLSQRLTIFAGTWPRTIEVADATLDDDFGAILEFDRLLAWWRMGEPIDPASIADPATRALAHAMLDQRDEAEAWLQRAIRDHPDEIATWDAVVVIHERWGRPIDRELAIGAAVRGGSFPSRDASPDVPRQTFDISAFRAYPRDGYVGAARRLGTRPPYPWILADTLP